MLCATPFTEVGYTEYLQSEKGWEAYIPQLSKITK